MSNDKISELREIIKDLNEAALEHQMLLDKLWELERKTADLRVRLVRLMSEIEVKYTGAENAS